MSLLCQKLPVLQTSVGGLAVAFAALLAAPSVDAETRTRAIYPNAAAWCQGALPAYSGTLRARPLAIMNEGEAPAFVTCSLPGGANPFSPQTFTVAVRVINRGNATRTVSCTLVNGHEANSGPIASYTPKSAQIAAGDGWSFSWNASELPGAPEVISNPNLSCQLPQDTGLAYLAFIYEEDVGQ